MNNAWKAFHYLSGFYCIVGYMYAPCKCTWADTGPWLGIGRTYQVSYNSYLPVIEVHEMHGWMHPNYWQITILLVVDLCSALAYFMMIQLLPIAGKLPIKTLVAKQLPTSIHTHTTTGLVIGTRLLHVQTYSLMWFPYSSKSNDMLHLTTRFNNRPMPLHYTCSC